MSKQSKSTKYAEIFKGLANQSRVEILMLLGKKPGLSLDEIAYKLSLNYKTTSVHISRMELSGLVEKEKQFHGQSVEHYLTTRGETLASLLKEVR